jgi:hypothetical protein
MDLIIHIWNAPNGDVRLLTSTAAKPTLEHGTFKRGNIGMQMFIVAYAHLTNFLSFSEVDIDVDLNTAADIHRVAKLFRDLPAAKVLVEAIEGDRGVLA